VWRHGAGSWRPPAHARAVTPFLVPGRSARTNKLLGNQQGPADRRADAPQTDSQLKHGRGMRRIAEHRRTIPAPFGHIRRSHFSPRFGAVSWRHVSNGYSSKGLISTWVSGRKPSKAIGAAIILLRCGACKSRTRTEAASLLLRTTFSRRSFGEWPSCERSSR
jgi:hypothetical protein